MLWQSIRCRELRLERGAKLHLQHTWSIDGAVHEAEGDVCAAIGLRAQVGGLREDVAVEGVGPQLEDNAFKR
jgi:hypothetical protein